MTEHDCNDMGLLRAEVRAANRAFVSASDRADGLARDLDNAWKIARRQNEEGGKARGVVAAVARVLDVDIDEGDGHRWDESHMWRVVDVAQRLSDDRDHWEREAVNWQREADAQREGSVEYQSLRATIVRQANEITALKETAA